MIPDKKFSSSTRSCTVISKETNGKKKEKKKKGFEQQGSYVRWLVWRSVFI